MLTASSLTLNGLPAYPVWREIIYSTRLTRFAGFDAVDFDITAGGAAIYSGRAAKRPGDAYVTIRLNDILSDLLRPTSQGYGPVTSHSAGWRFRGIASVFAVVVKDPAGSLQDVTEEGVVFGDWTYDYGHGYIFPPSPVEGTLNQFPQALQSELVSPVADPRQYIIASTIKGTRFRIYQGENPVFAHDALTAEDARTYAVKAENILSQYPGAQPRFYFTVDWSNENLQTPANLYDGHADGRYDVEVRTTCARYCLYYLNARGGWDWLLIQGKAVETDDITRSVMERRGETNLFLSTLQHRGKDVVSENVVRHLELHTHWLTDREAGLMHHLTESPDVYVHDLEEGVIHPAVLTGNSHKYKTYRGEGNRLVQYTVDLDFAVEMRRR